MVNARTNRTNPKAETTSSDSSAANAGLPNIDDGTDLTAASSSSDSRAANAGLPNIDERNKKRKVLDDELEDTDLEQRFALSEHEPATNFKDKSLPGFKRNKWSRMCVRTESGFYKDHAWFEDWDDGVQMTEALVASGSTTASRTLRVDQTPAISASQTSQNTSATERFPDTGATSAALLNSNDRIKKRRALEDALDDIEFEQRQRRVQRELARLEEDAE
jgi:hypothetical protein